jgi:hypothetical protein
VDKTGIGVPALDTRACGELKWHMDKTCIGAPALDARAWEELKWCVDTRAAAQQDRQAGVDQDG